MFDKLQSMLEFVFGSNIQTIFYVLAIVFMVVNTIQHIKGRSKNDRDI